MAHEQDRVLTPLANLEGEVATGNRLIMDVSAVKLMLFLQATWREHGTLRGIQRAHC